MKKLAVILALMLALLCATASAEGLEGFDVIKISPTEAPADAAAPGDASGTTETDDVLHAPGTGIEVEIGANTVLREWNGASSDTHVWVAVDCTLTNWTLSKVNIAESLKATLIYNGEYKFSGEPVFATEYVDVMEQYDGQLVFKVPYIVALAQPNELKITTAALDEELSSEIDLTGAAEALRAEVGQPAEFVAVGGLEAQIGANTVLREWKGETSDAHVWVAVDCTLTNWTLDKVRIADSMKATLIYNGEYEFSGEPVFTVTQLDIVEQYKGQLVFKVPNIVALAQPDELELTTTALDEELRWDINLTDATEKLRAKVEQPFEFAAVGGVEVAPGTEYVLDMYKGQSDEAGDYYVQDMWLINWGKEAIALDENTLKGMVACFDQYGFPLVFYYPQESLAPLEAVEVEAAARVPKLATKSEAGAAVLKIFGDMSDFSVDIDMKQAAENGVARNELEVQAYEAAVHRAAMEAFRVEFTLGNTVKFGHYEQDGDATNGKEDIEWIVLAEDGDKYLLVSKYGLDCCAYHTSFADITWADCSLRAWLNNDFLNAAFSAKEQTGIVTSDVDNSKSQGYSGWSTNGGSNTQDKVFLLSYAEAWYYFSTDATRKCAPTNYAIKQGAYTYSSYKADGRATGWWWLRSPGHHQNDAAFVRSDGSRNYHDVTYGGGSVRPAFWLDLDSDIY